MRTEIFFCLKQNVAFSRNISCCKNSKKICMKVNAFAIHVFREKMHMTPHRMEMGKYFKIYADLWNEYNFDKNFFSFFKIIWCMEKSGHFYSKIVPKWKGYWLAKLQKGKNLIREDEKYHKTTSIKSQDIFADDPAANTKVLCASKIKKRQINH